jgi:hypothetical protein
MPTSAPRAPRRLVALAVAALAAAAAIAGCASSSGAGGTDPAGLVPASAPVYLEAVVHPAGDEAAEARAAMAKILRTSDPAGKLVAAFDGHSGDVQFARDIEPWLGDRVGASLLSVSGDRPDSVVVAASTDDGKAQEAIDRILAGGDKQTYRDVDYTYDAHERSAAAVVGGAVVIGTEAGVKAAVDASKGSSLAESDALEKARETVSQERSGFAYLDVGRLLRQAVGAAGDGAAQAAPFLDPIANVLPKTVAAALDAEPDLLRFDTAAFGQPASTRADKSGADALAALPADAWLGAGAGDVGQTLTKLLDGIVQGGGIGGIGIEALLRQMQQSTGLDIRRDLLAWMGDAGVFLSGTTRDDAGGALVVSSKDRAATQATVRKLRTLLGAGREVRPLDVAGVDEGFIARGERGSGHDLHVAAAGDRFIVATSERALRQAMSPGDTLGSAPALTDAAAKLGGGVRPSFFLDVQRLVTLMDAAQGSDRHAAKLKPYLEAFGVVVGGGRADGDITRGRAIATLK